MKKSLSFLLALIAVASLSLNAFALENENAQQNDLTHEEIVAENENENKNENTQESGVTEILEAGLSLGKAENSQLTLSGLIQPNQTLRFPILLTDENGKTVPLSDAHLEENRIRVETKDGRSAVNSIKVVEDNGTYLLEVKTLSGYPTKQTDYLGQLKLVKKTSGAVLHALDLSFSVGYASLSDEAVEAAKNGEYIFVDGSTPVITGSQFDQIDKALGGEKATLTNGSWTFEVRVTEQDSVNMLNNERAIKEIVTQFEDQNFKFLSFPAGPAFDFTGTLTIDVSDVMDDFDGNFYVYSYYNGRLNKVYATFNDFEETVSFKTKYMGRFVITDKEIKNGTVVENSSDDTGAVQPSNPSKPNPDTGAGLMGKLAAVMATLSASVLGLLGIKKEQK